MSSGFETKSSRKNGFDVEHARVQLNAEVENKRISAQFMGQVVQHLFSSNFLVFLVICAVIASGFVYMTHQQDSKDVFEYWRLLIPIITTYIGYAIGRSTGSGGS